MERKREVMIKNTILSMIIGTLATYLPFWQWEDMAVQIIGAVAIGVLSFMLLLATEPEEEV